jgi:GxxExxY protein
MPEDYRHSDITARIIGAAYEVHNGLGPGFLEKVYENALLVELTRAGLAVRQQEPMKVTYKGANVGEFAADLVVEEKAVSQLTKEHEVQLVNYLRASGINVGLLVNFGRSVQVKRRAFDL